MQALFAEDAMQADTVAVIGGTGDQGYGLALRWAKAGKRVIIGSRMREKAEEFKQSGGKIYHEVGSSAETANVTMRAAPKH